MLSTRLLMGYAGSPMVASQTLLAAPYGGWTQTSGPKAAQYNGYVYIGSADGTTGDIDISYYRLSDGVHATGTVHLGLTTDTHNAPSVWVRASDHRLVIVYSQHDGPTMYERVSVNTLDSDPIISGGLQTELDLDSALGGTAYTYPFIGQLTDGTWFLFYRDHEDALQTGIVTYSTSSNGETWAAETQLIKRALEPIYVMVHFGGNRIDVAYSDGNGVTEAHVSLYHTYYQSGDWHKTDGTVITATRPWAVTQGTLVHDGSAYPNSWPSGMAMDSSGAPVILSEQLDTQNGHAYDVVYSRWNGASWDATTITSFNDTGLVLIAHSCLDESDPRVAYIVKPVSSVWEVFRYRTTDQGATWTGEQLTSGSSSPGNVYPANIHARTDSLRAIWMFGSYTSTTSFNTGTKGTQI